MKKILNWIIDKWLGGFITATIFFLIKIYIDLPKERKINFFNFDWFIEIINYNISLWIVFIIITAIVIINRFEKKNLRKKLTAIDSPENNIPLNTFGHFTSDIFGVNQNKWTWNYKWNSLKQHFEIFDLKPICKICNSEMEYSHSDYSHNYASCSKCRLEGRAYFFPIAENIIDVEKEIIRKIRNKEI